LSNAASLAEIIDFEILNEIVRDWVTNMLVEGGFGNKLVPYGSRFVCDPPTRDTDIDFFFYVDNLKAKELEILLKDHGFDVVDNLDNFTSSRPSWGEANDDHRFTSWHKDKINLVVTSSEVFAQRHITATRICKKLNLLDKKDRVMIYKAVLYGEFNAEQ
jgi:hypothetical protein